CHHAGTEAATDETIKTTGANRWLRQIAERVVRADHLKTIVSAPYPRADNGETLGARDTLVEGLNLRPKGPLLSRHTGVGICCNDMFERDMSERICCSVVAVSHVH